MTISRLTKSARRVPASAAILAALCLSAACGSQVDPAPAPAPAPTSAAPVEQPKQAAGAGTTPLRDSFNAANSSASWADKVKSIQLDGSAVIVISNLTKSDKTTTRAICEAAYKAAKDSKVEFLGIAVRSADDSTLAHRNDKYGPAACEN